MDLVTLDPQIAFAQARWDGLTDEERAIWLRAAMASVGVRAAELSRRLHLSSQTLSAWTAGRWNVDWSRWMSVCLALGIPQTWTPEEASTKKRPSTPKARAH